MSAHTGKEGRDEPQELLLHQSAGAAPGAEKSLPFGVWGAVPRAGSCTSPAVLTFTDQSVLYNI